MDPFIQRKEVLLSFVLETIKSSDVRIYSTTFGFGTYEEFVEFQSEMIRNASEAIVKKLEAKHNFIKNLGKSEGKALLNLPIVFAFDKSSNVILMFENGSTIIFT